MTAKLSLFITAVIALSCAAKAQSVKPSQIVSLYSDTATCGAYFCLKDTRRATNHDLAWSVPTGKIFMLTDINTDCGATNGDYQIHAILVTRNNDLTNHVVATFFGVGYGQLNQSFSTPIPIGTGIRITHDATNFTNCEVILRGYLTTNG